MKKYLPLLLLAFISLFIYSCDNNDDVVFDDHDTYSVAYDISPIFSKVNSNFYEFGDEFTKPLVESDVVLVYLQTGVTTAGPNTPSAPIWKLLPYSEYPNATDIVDYAFDFSKYDITISVKSSLNLDTNSTYYTNKRFRVVIVPASTGKNANIDYNDYNSVIKYYNIDESKIKLKP